MYFYVEIIMGIILIAPHFLSREILNKRFYRRIVRKNFKYFDKFFIFLMKLKIF